MPEFLAEVYVSDRSAAAGLPGVDDVHRAAEGLVTGSTPVRLVRQIHVAEEETCFLLFEAPSKELVLDAADRCGLRIDRIVGAVSVPPARSAHAKVRVPTTQEEP